MSTGVQCKDCGEYLEFDAEKKIWFSCEYCKTHCVMCGVELDCDLDHENSCRRCE